MRRIGKQKIACELIELKRFGETSHNYGYRPKEQKIAFLWHGNDVRVDTDHIRVDTHVMGFFVLGSVRH